MWTTVQGVLAPLQFFVFLVSLALVAVAACAIPAANASKVDPSTALRWD